MVGGDHYFGGCGSSNGGLTQLKAFPVEAVAVQGTKTLTIVGDGTDVGDITGNVPLSGRTDVRP